VAGRPRRYLSEASMAELQASDPIPTSGKELQVAWSASTALVVTPTCATRPPQVGRTQHSPSESSGKLPVACLATLAGARDSTPRSWLRADGEVTWQHRVGPGTRRCGEVWWRRTGRSAARRGAGHRRPRKFPQPKLWRRR
jgi:hypothetical protein